MGIKYKINSDFFKTWSPEMAYVLGFIAADGSLEDASYLRGKYLRISSTDREIIDKIKNIMCSEHTIVPIAPRETFFKDKQYVCREKYLLRIGSHEIYNDLLKLGIMPHKSKVIQLPDVPNNFLPYFLRGYLDGDGCIHFYAKRNRLSVIFTSGSKIFLEQLAERASAAIGVKNHTVFANSRAFQIRYSTKEAVSLLNNLYADIDNQLFLSRKYFIYKKFCGAMAEKLGNGLQNRVHRCDSGSRLQ